MAKPIDNFSPGAMPDLGAERPKTAQPEDEDHFSGLMEGETETPPETAKPHPFAVVMPDWSGMGAVGGGSKPGGNNEVFKEPEKPAVPDPKTEQPSNFWGKLKAGADSLAKDVMNFLGSPEFAQFAKVANIVFAGGLVVAAGVMAATGVGAPATVALLAIAGGVGLAMQAPPVQQKIQAGVEAIIAPVVGAENAAKLSPLLAQGVVTASMIGILVSGGGAGSVQGAVDAAMAFFKTAGDITNGIAQAYTAAEPFLSMVGIDLNPQAIGQLGSLFGTLGSLVPSINSYTQGIGQSLTEFIANPDAGKFLDFLKTSGTTLPPDLLKVIDNSFLSNLGTMIQSFESFLRDPSVQGLADFLNKLR